MNLKEILERKAEIKKDLETRSATITNEEIEKYSNELKELEEKEEAINKRNELLSKLNFQKEEKNEKEDVAKRGKMYKRAGEVVNTGDNGVLVPTYSSKEVTPIPFSEVSSIVDLVKVVALPNGSEYTKSFQVSTGEGDYTLEATQVGTGADGLYHETDTAFDKVTVKRNKITAIEYESEEMYDLPDANFAELVEGNIAISLKKKIAKEIILGDGSGSHFQGLASAGLNANTYKDESVSTIDKDLLVKLQVGYQGGDGVQGMQYLIMNKETINDFVAVNDENGRSIYNVVINPNGNTAMINTTPVVFTSHLKPFKTASTNDVTMLYGDLSQYLVLDFGGQAIEVSKEFKFNQGVVTIRGKQYSGGNLAGYKAFTRVKKSA